VKSLKNVEKLNINIKNFKIEGLFILKPKFVEDKRGNFTKFFNYDELKNFNPKYNLKKGIEEIYNSYINNNMNSDKFQGRFFIRFKQVQYLIDNKKVDNKNLY
jgi:dTDP-4-dehydrorhamnose 3,5-epimerase-like enzyme